MIANYHTHTPRCNHAQGSEEDYVRSALEAGLQILGFSDHTPYPFPPSHYSGFRMEVNQLGDYADAVRYVQKRFATDIQIHLGVEAEFYPTYFRDMVAMLRDNGVEYMILGQHMLGNEIGEPYLVKPADDRSLERYCDQTIEAMHTGLFTYFAHPDLINHIGSEQYYQAQMRRLCKAANSCHIPLEINLLGLNGGRNYPNPLFWEVAAEEGCHVILGRDAHQPEALLDGATERQALELAKQLELKLLDTVPLQRID